MKMNRFILLAIAAVASAAAVAQTADDVDCDRCVDTADLMPKSVTTAKLENNSVTVRKLAPASVNTGNIRKGSVTPDKLSPAVTSKLNAPRVVVVDAADVELPIIYYGPGDDEDNGTYRYSNNGELVGIPVLLSPEFIGTAPVWYDALDCGGNPYVLMFTESSFPPDFVINSFDLFQRTGAFTILPLFSLRDEEGECENNIIEFGTAAPLTLIDSISYSPPLRLELR